MNPIASSGRLLSLVGGGLAFSGFALTGGANAQTVLYTKLGAGTNDRLGASVGDAGYFDADLFPDFIAGAPEDFSAFSPAPGYARVYSGVNGNVLLTIPGLSNWDAFGSSVDGAGDVNMDGRDDVIIGAPSAGDSQRGKATVVSGATGLVLFTFTGDEDLDFLGRSVSRAGDVDDDGRDDVLVGIPNHDTPEQDNGQARVYSGLDGHLIWAFNGTDSGQQVGFSVSELGDTNDDGHADVLVGSQAGGAKLYSGLTGNALLNFTGPSNSNFGKSVSAIPDVTGDGKPDVLIAGTQESILTPGPGFVRCFNGVTGQQLWSVSGTSDGDRFGIALSGAGDWNGDGTPDAVVAADPTNGALENYVRILSGTNGAVLITIEGDTPQDDYGRSVAGLGDLNGDGHTKVCVGASTASLNGTASGYARVYSGPGMSCTGEVLTYCVGAVNSTGLGSTMLTSGTTSIGMNDLVLLALNCPPGQNGIFYYGPNQVQQPFGNGFRCVGGQTFRLLPPAPANGAGLASRALDLTAPPANSGPGMISAGSVWNFQYWYRDPAGGGDGFNLSNAKQIQFCP